MNFGDWFNENIKSNATNSIYLNIYTELQKYPTFNKWINLFYYNFTLLFDAETFGRKFLGLLTNKNIELNRIETVNNFIKSRELTEDDLGTVVTQTSQTKANTTGKVSNSYSGYNVDNAEFNNSTNSTDATNSGTNSTTSVNRVEQLYNMANYELRSLFNNIYIELIQLFKTIY